MTLDLMKNTLKRKTRMKETGSGVRTKEETRREREEKLERRKPEPSSVGHR